MPRALFRTIIVLAFIAGIAYLIYSRLQPQGGWGQQQGAPPVSVAQVIDRDVRIWREFSGRLVAVDQAEIRPQVSGVIEKVHFRDGALVKKGQLLFTIDPRPYAAALQAAAARAAFAGAQFRRAAALIADKAIPQSEYDQRKNDADVAQAALATARLNLDYTAVEAPISGRAGRAEITVGNLVESGSSAPLLTTVVASDPIYADFEIDEDTYLKYIEAHATTGKETRHIPVMLSLTGENGAPHEGHVESFDNRLDTASGTLRVRAVFDNKDGSLVPGLFARIRLGAAEPLHALLITDRAVGTDQSKKYVIVVGKDGKTEHREVTLGPLADGLRVVESGLKPGEDVVVNGLQRIMMPGQMVKPEMVPMEDVIPAQAGIQKSGADEKK
ncbi:MAG: efflux RND transporter periplasmic adaptor subunit [Pseudomonadota bacterium]|nr:efflux RND transporter periplasmic adaptor subunit [Pseudomonadota bacterium]MDE3037845.1 efflux RND transporter periplasmic adaptor subunit [Pseudomonadota bacterium]